MKTWQIKLLGEVAQISAGDPAPQRAEDFSNNGVPFVRMQDVGRFGQTTCLTKTRDRLSASISPKFKRFPAGSILVPKSGASIRLNHRAILGVEAHVVSHLAVIVPQASLNTRFAYYWLCGINLSGVAHDADLPSMKTSELAKLQIPVPPLAEQEYIVNLLDEADRLRKLRAQADQRTADLLPALFHKMFGDGTVNCKTASIENSVERFIDYRGKTPEKSESGVPLVTAKIVKGGNILPPNEFIPEDSYDAWMRRGLPHMGDVLFTMEAPLGEVAMVEDTHIALAQRILLMRPQRELLDSRYFMTALKMPCVWRQIEERATGSTVRGIRQAELRKVQLPIPPLTLQKEFAARAMEIRKLEVEQAASRAKLDSLFQSMLHRAFNGEL